MSQPTESDGAPIAAALLIITPVLAALAAWAVPRLLALGEHPIGWLAGIAAAAVTITAVAAAVESAPQRDPARTVWPLLLAWPLAFPLYMNSRDRLGSGLAGALLLAGALAWSTWQVHRGEEAAAWLLQTSNGAIDSTPTGEAEMSEAERIRILRQRVDAMLDAER
ncbi:MAG: hypothetical protein KJ889_01620 [Gammaproteobacteria bacterium]|nr:hypothetical protein [Gammaproteobacteria bacterium]